MDYELKVDETFETCDSDNASMSSDEISEWTGSEESETEVTESDSNEYFSCNNDSEIDSNYDEPENTKEELSFCFTSEENEGMVSSKNEFFRNSVTEWKVFMAEKRKVRD